MCHKEAELFKVLGVESRIRIIDLLKQRGPLYVNELAQILGITPSAVSQHLKILRHAGLVRSQRKGYWIPYEVDQAALEQCGQVISNVCRCGCEGSCRVADETTGAEAGSVFRKLPHPNPLPEGEVASGFGALNKAKPISNRNTGMREEEHVYLQRLEQELEEELQKVRARIEKVRGET
jgi:DNA-binding transcriptional ArsR family regulator